LQNFNPDLKAIEPYYLYRFIGNETDTSIYKNDYCPVNNEEFELTNYNSLKRLSPNNREVTAYWLPGQTGQVDKVYLYQGDTYIGEAINRASTAYNECAIERTDNDRENMLYQQKRVAQFDKFIKETRASIPKLESSKKEASKQLQEVEVEVVGSMPIESEPSEFDYYEYEDFAAKAINDI
jgi:hypothetical protein